MKKLIALLLFVFHASLFVSEAQERRPIDSQHPLWMIHIDVWNSADPQKIIDLIPEDIKPYVCMNLSLSCQFDTETSMYRMPRNAVRTYKSWATVCQQNNMWFTCQPASGGHTHVQDNDLETFEYFFKTFPNFLGWNYAEQFWAFGDAGDLSSMTKASRWNLFANLVEMSHKYGGFLTVSWCGGIYHFDTDPIAELKTEPRFLEACKNYPEAILFLYKYTHCSSFYNNESACFGPFISGLTKNYGVRYDNCGWNDMTTKLLGKDHGKKYPGAAGIGTVMEQTCVNGGAVWDGPELIWTEDFQNLGDTNVDGYTRRNWGTFDNFKGIWLDMWRKIIDGTMYIPTREEVVAKTKAVLVHDADNDFKVPDALYDGLYKVNDPGNPGDGHFENNLWYLKSTGRYGAIPMVTGLYDDVAQAIPVQVKKSAYNSRWGTQSKKVAEFNTLYPEVSTGDLYVNRYKNQLVTYTPYTYFNKKKRATAEIPLQYNTSSTLKLSYGKLSSGVIREYVDHIDIYLNNYRSDTTTAQIDTIIVTGATATHSHTWKKHTTGAAGTSPIVAGAYDSATESYKVVVRHMGPVDVTIKCSGAATDRQTDVLPSAALETPVQPAPYAGPITIEAENMDRKYADIALTHSGWWAQDMKDFAGMGYVTTQGNTNCALRHQLKLSQAGQYNIRMRYCNTTKTGQMTLTVNGTALKADIANAAKNDWREAVVTADMIAGTNNLVIQNTSSFSGMIIDQVTYEPVGTEPEKYLVTVRDADFGSVTADVSEAAAGESVKLTITPDEGYAIKELRVVNSIFFTQGLTIPVTKDTKTVSFTMRDENMTIQPVFYDTKAIYELDFTNVSGGELPVGWRTTDGSDVRNYPTSNGSGPRTFSGLTGYQGKALYWRTTSAEYGRLADYRLTLEPGHYQLQYAMAAWKGTPTYQAKILSSSGSTIKSSASLTASPSLNGNFAGDLSGTKRLTLDFDITTKGNYIIQFKEVGSGMQEFLLAECKVRSADATGIMAVGTEGQSAAEGIYDLSGVKSLQLHRGLNIIRTADGRTIKIMKK